MSEERIRISRDDAFTPRVDEILAREGSFGMRPDQFAAREDDKPKGILGFLYSSVFYTAVAGALGAFAGWAIIEPHFGEQASGSGQDGFFEGVGYMLLWPIIGGLTGTLVGCVEGLVSRNWNRALMGGLIGMGIAAAGSFVLSFLTGILYMVLMVASFLLCRGNPGGVIAFLLMTLSRALAWAPLGLCVGLGPAVYMRSRKLAFNAVVGGLIGAFLGGLLFNPLYEMFKGGGEAWLSRGVGFTLIGMGAGAMIGLVENLAKSAWLHVQAGALSGKQFVIYKNPTVLGSSPKCEIFLFKDEQIEPKHAAIHKYGNRYEIEDLDSPAGTFVNGRKVTRQPLKNGDRIYLGETVLDFSEREQE